MHIINAEEYNANPLRYELRNGNREDAPNCPFGNKYEWIGYDLETKEYVHFTKSIFKRLKETK